MLLGQPVSRSAPIVDGSRDWYRIWVVRAITLIYVLAILEGVLRKWLLPSYSQLLFFIRDPVVLAAYVVAVAGGLWPRGRALLYVGLILAVAALVVAAGQLAFGGTDVEHPMLFAAYGWRNYFLYLPLAFVVADVFEATDIARVIRITLLLSLPIAVLVIVQFYAPLDSWINVGLGDSPQSQFAGLALTEDHTRPMGPFTSNLGQREYVVSGLAMIIGAWLSERWRMLLRRRELVVGTLGMLTCLAISGSRGVVINTGILTVVAIAAIALQAGQVHRGRALGWFAAIVVVALVAYPLVFPDSYHAIATRWQVADEFESTRFTGGVFGRALYGLVDFLRLMDETPLLGFGLGLGGNASTLMGLLIGGESPVSVAETDWARHIVDLGPVLGLMYLVFRVALTIALLREAITSLRRGSLMSFLIFGFVGSELLAGQITGQGSVNAYAWLFAGFCLASARQHLSHEISNPNVDTKPRFPSLLR